MTEAEDQISPRAIKRCQLCLVRNFARGGRTADGKWHPFYEGESAIEKRIRPPIGRLAWCGQTGPEQLLRITRIVCTPVEMSAGETMNLCQRCARTVGIQSARDSDERAA
jgi:hypothetical protein